MLALLLINSLVLGKFISPASVSTCIKWAKLISNSIGCGEDHMRECSQCAWSCNVLTIKKLTRGKHSSVQSWSSPLLGSHAVSLH